MINILIYEKGGKHMEQEYIVHSGTKGMHWGTRLFQYKDGSLTPLGKIRYRKKRQEKLDNEQSNEPAKKSVKDMSDSELKEALNRQRMEREYLDLNRQISELNPKKVSAGKRFISYVGNNVIKPAATEAAKNTLSKFFQDKSSKILGLDKKEVADSLDSLKNESEKLRLKRNIEENKDWFKNREKDTTSNKTSETKTENADKKESKTKTESANKTETKTKSEGPMTGTVFGEGTSRKSTSSNTKTDNSWWKSKTYYTDDFRDISNKGKSYYNSSANNDFMNNSTNSSYMSDLAREGKNYFPPYLLESAK